MFGDAWTARDYVNQELSEATEGVFAGRTVFPKWTFPCNERGILGKTAEGRDVRSINAAIPIIPPGLKPTKGLQKYHILWEVDNWVAGSTTPEHSRDPLLLKHIGSWFFVIVAEWDLTEVERQVYRLSQRR